MRTEHALLLVALAGIMAGLYLHEVAASILALVLALVLIIRGLDSMRKPGGL